MGGGEDFYYRLRSCRHHCLSAVCVFSSLGELARSASTRSPRLFLPGIPFGAGMQRAQLFLVAVGFLAAASARRVAREVAL